MSTYKYCIVPLCISTTIATPDKLFFRMPDDIRIRKKWMVACWRQQRSLSYKSRVYVCEDHFDIDKDLENYLQWTLIKVRPKLRKDVLPHKFACQQRGIYHERQSANKVAAKKIVGELMREDMTRCSAPFCYNSSSTQMCDNNGLPVKITFHAFPLRNQLMTQQWVKNMGRPETWIPTANSRICSDHFEKKWFSSVGNHLRLAPNAVPTIFGKSVPMLYQLPSYKKMHKASTSTAVEPLQNPVAQSNTAACSTISLVSSNPKIQQKVLMIQQDDGKRICYIEKPPQHQAKQIGHTTQILHGTNLVSIVKATNTSSSHKNTIMNVTSYENTPITIPANVQVSASTSVLTHSVATTGDTAHAQKSQTSNIAMNVSSYGDSPGIYPANVQTSTSTTSVTAYTQKSHNSGTAMSVTSYGEPLFIYPAIVQANTLIASVTANAEKGQNSYNAINVMSNGNTPIIYPTNDQASTLTASLTAHDQMRPTLNTMMNVTSNENTPVIYPANVQASTSTASFMAHPKGNPTSIVRNASSCENAPIAFPTDIQISSSAPSFVTCTKKNKTSTFMLLPSDLINKEEKYPTFLMELPSSSEKCLLIPVREKCKKTSAASKTLPPSQAIISKSFPVQLLTTNTNKEVSFVNDKTTISEIIHQEATVTDNDVMIIGEYVRPTKQGEYVRPTKQTTSSNSKNSTINQSFVSSDHPAHIGIMTTASVPTLTRDISSGEHFSSSTWNVCDRGQLSNAEVSSNVRYNNTIAVSSGNFVTPVSARLINTQETKTQSNLSANNNDVTRKPQTVCLVHKETLHTVPTTMMSSRISNNDYASEIRKKRKAKRTFFEEVYIPEYSKSADAHTSMNSTTLTSTQVENAISPVDGSNVYINVIPNYIYETARPSQYISPCTDVQNNMQHTSPHLPSKSPANLGTFCGTNVSTKINDNILVTSNKEEYLTFSAVSSGNVSQSKKQNNETSDLMLQNQSLISKPIKQYNSKLDMTLSVVSSQLEKSLPDSKRNSCSFNNSLINNVETQQYSDAPEECVPECVRKRRLEDTEQGTISDMSDTELYDLSGLDLKIDWESSHVDSDSELDEVEFVSESDFLTSPSRENVSDTDQSLRRVTCNPSKLHQLKSSYSVTKEHSIAESNQRSQSTIKNTIKNMPTNLIQNSESNVGFRKFLYESEGTTVQKWKLSSNLNNKRASKCLLKRAASTSQLTLTSPSEEKRSKSVCEIRTEPSCITRLKAKSLGIEIPKIPEEEPSCVTKMKRKLARQSMILNQSTDIKIVEVVSLKEKVPNSRATDRHYHNEPKSIERKSVYKDSELVELDEHFLNSPAEKRTNELQSCLPEDHNPQYQASIGQDIQSNRNEDTIISRIKCLMRAQKRHWALMRKQEILNKSDSYDSIKFQESRNCSFSEPHSIACSSQIIPIGPIPSTQHCFNTHKRRCVAKKSTGGRKSIKSKVLNCEQTSCSIYSNVSTFTTEHRSSKIVNPPSVCTSKNASTIDKHHKEEMMSVTSRIPIKGLKPQLKIHATNRGKQHVNVRNMTARAGKGLRKSMRACKPNRRLCEEFVISLNENERNSDDDIINNFAKRQRATRKFTTQASCNPTPFTTRGRNNTTKREKTTSRSKSEERVKTGNDVLGTFWTEGHLISSILPSKSEMALNKLFEKNLELVRRTRELWPNEKKGESERNCVRNRVRERRRAKSVCGYSSCHDGSSDVRVTSLECISQPTSISSMIQSLHLAEQRSTDTSAVSTNVLTKMVTVEKNELKSANSAEKNLELVRRARELWPNEKKGESEKNCVRNRVRERRRAKSVCGYSSCHDGSSDVRVTSLECISQPTSISSMIQSLHLAEQRSTDTSAVSTSVLTKMVTVEKNELKSANSAAECSTTANCVSRTVSNLKNSVYRTYAYQEVCDLMSVSFVLRAKRHQRRFQLQKFQGYFSFRWLCLWGVWKNMCFFPIMSTDGVKEDKLVLSKHIAMFLSVFNTLEQTDLISFVLYSDKALDTRDVLFNTEVRNITINKVSLKVPEIKNTTFRISDNDFKQEMILQHGRELTERFLSSFFVAVHQKNVLELRHLLESSNCPANVVSVLMKFNRLDSETINRIMPHI